MKQLLFIILILAYSCTVRADSLPSVITHNHWDNCTGWICTGTATSVGGTDTPDQSNALRFTYNIGYDDGSGTEGLAQFDFSPNQNDMYFGHWFKYSTNFEWHTINNKVSVLVFGGGGSNYVLGVWGSQQGGNSRKIVVTQQPNASPCATANRFSNTGYNPTIVPDQWYWVETHSVMNTPGVSDGVVEVWLDGNLLMSHSNMCFRGTSQTTLQFGLLNHSPIWGGNHATNDCINTPQSCKTQLDYIWFDYTVISTQPIGYPGGGGGPPTGTRGTPGSSGKGFGGPFQ